MDPMDTRIDQMTVARNLSSSSAPGTVDGPVRPRNSQRVARTWHETI